MLEAANVLVFLFVFVKDSNYCNKFLKFHLLSPVQKPPIWQVLAAKTVMQTSALIEMLLFSLSLFPLYI